LFVENKIFLLWRSVEGKKSGLSLGMAKEYIGTETSDTDVDRGGTLTLTSTEGVGTIVTVTLPLRE
jgi:signal transduction histidine kinase